MHALIHYLIDNKQNTLEELIKHSGDDVTPQNAANVIQFSFLQLAKAINNKQFANKADAQVVLTKLFELLSAHQSAFTDTNYIATIFNTLGQITHSDQINVSLVKQHQDVLKQLLTVLAESTQLNAKAIATLFHGLGRLKDNDALPETQEWQSANFLQKLILIIDKLLNDKPNAQAITMTILGFSKLQFTPWSNTYQMLLEVLLSRVLTAFIELQHSNPFNSKIQPNAQEISSILYAIAKLSKQDALYLQYWQEDSRQNLLHQLIELTFKKKPTSQSISHIFYALGKLAHKQYLLPQKEKLAWLMRSLIKYAVYQFDKIGHMTIVSIFVSLGRLAEGNFLLKSHWQTDDYKIINMLFIQLFNDADFNQPDNIADLFSSLGKLVEADIIPLSLLDPYMDQFDPLIKIVMTHDSLIKPSSKNRFILGIQKLKQKEKSNSSINNFDARQSTGSLSNNTLLHRHTYTQDTGKSSADKSTSGLNLSNKI